MPLTAAFPARFQLQAAHTAEFPRIACYQSKPTRTGMCGNQHIVHTCRLTGNFPFGTYTSLLCGDGYPHRSAKSQIATEALTLIAQLYEVEREIAQSQDTPITPQLRQEIRQKKARPITETLHAWLLTQRAQVPNGSGTAQAIDYSLKRWSALTHYLDDGQVSIDNNWIENQIRPIALGRKNWLFAGSLRAGQRAAAIMSLIQSARLNGHDPCAYLKDVLNRLPTHLNSRIEELLPHRWQPQA